MRENTECTFKLLSVMTPRLVVHETIKMEIALVNLVRFIQCYLGLVTHNSVLSKTRKRKLLVIQPIMFLLLPANVKKEGKKSANSSGSI